MKEQKGIENQVVDHLSTLEDESLLELVEKGEINYMFLDEKLLETSHHLIHWYADFAIYLESDVVQEDLSSHQKKKFMHDAK